MGSIEVRGFGNFKNLFKKRSWPFPLIFELDREISGLELAHRLDIDINNIEIVFVNGRACRLDHPVKPGDRVAFVPPGTPGPYRVLFGFFGQKKPT